MSDNIRLATETDLKWLNNGFDEAALERIDAAHLEKAIKASGTPPHWLAPAAQGNTVDDG